MDSESGEFLKDVTVTALESKKIQVTDENGNFSFDGISFPLKLKFSFIGYTTTIIAVDEVQLDKIITLQREVDQLSEIVLRSSNIPKNLLQESSAVSGNLLCIGQPGNVFVVGLITLCSTPGESSFLWIVKKRLFI